MYVFEYPLFRAGCTQASIGATLDLDNTSSGAYSVLLTLLIYFKVLYFRAIRLSATWYQMVRSIYSFSFFRAASAVKQSPPRVMPSVLCVVGDDQNVVTAVML